jgi:hypothetical protein
MPPLTLFSFGYYGWGNATPKLVELVDAVERGRGFAPPVFVDIRIRRSVRAVGFNGSAFENLLGADRHRWMSALGNRHILTREGPFIQIARPDAAYELLDLAVDLADRGRRLLFLRLPVAAGGRRGRVSPLHGRGAGRGRCPAARRARYRRGMAGR